MSVSKAKLTVYFDDPFWVALYEREEPDGHRVCKVTFGGEPRDREVLDFFLRHWRELEFSPAVSVRVAEDRKQNPKRMRREAERALRPAGTGTKAQQALQLQREQMKTEWKVRSREQREAEQARKFALRQEKRRQKHRGH